MLRLTTCLADKKKCITSSLNEDRALLQINSQFFKEFNHTYAENKVKIATYEEKCKQQEELVYKIGKTLTTTELLLYQKRLKYVTQRMNGDTYDSVNLTIDQEEKIVALEGSIKKFLEEHQKANSSLSLLNDHLNQCKEQDQAHQLRFNEIKGNLCRCED